MRSNACVYCGSLNFIADRALGGKLICQRCARPVYKAKNFNQSMKIKRPLLLFSIFILIILLFIISS